MKWFHICIIAAIGIVVEVQLLNVATEGMRYHMDFCFLLCIAVLFKVIFEYINHADASDWIKKYSLCVNYLGLFTMAVTFLLFFTSGDSALVDVDPELANKLSRFFVLHDIV